LYAPVRRFDFVNFDDPEYVTRNMHVRGGVTPQGLEWALTSGEAANWFPLTRFSHMLDGQFFGLRGGWHHLVSVGWHALAAVLLFAFLARCTHARWPSAWVAFLFALHPLHVESVAWVAERKDVLCAFFWFLALWAYVRYAERPGRGRYLLVLLLFCLGLMSKPMIVTLPFLLLLLDAWPLRRFSPAAVREKIPFFVLAAVSAIATYLVQHASGAVKEVARLPLGLRIENALVSCAIYCLDTIWPAGLAVFYPYPNGFAWWMVAAAGLVIAVITALTLRSFRSAPYLAVGWIWYLVTLAPVIGLVQVGAQARADRYMYVPMVGLTIMLAWGAAGLARRWQAAERPIAAAAIATCLGAAALSASQIEYWRNSETLFRHALDVTTDNYLAEHNLGSYLLNAGRLSEAMTHLQAALRIRPDSATARSDLASALARTPGRLPEAIAEYQAALRLLPDSAILHNNLGAALVRFPDRLPEAIRECQAALRIDPDYAEAHNNLASALAQTPGRLPEAIAEYQAALRIDPDYAEAHHGLGLALAETPGHLADAMAEYRAALRIRPDYPEAHNDLGLALAETPGHLAEAMTEYQAALRIQPDYPEAHYNLGVALAKTGGRLPEAAAEFEAALRLKPDYAEAHNDLGVALAQAPGRTSEAIGHFQAALRIQPDYAEAHYNLGVALSQIPGRLPEAIAQLEAALRLKPDPELRRTVDRLRAGR
jgi:tetratricopeptide (TPR) repeat protein